MSEPVLDFNLIYGANVFWSLVAVYFALVLIAGATVLAMAFWNKE